MSEPTPTVFVVDDDPEVLKALGRLLAAIGLAVAAFDSPQAFLERFDGRVPGCLVLDLAMPSLDGLALQQALADRGSTMPIVFLTGHGDIPTSVRAMKRGAVDFLTKPVDEAALLAAIDRAMEADRMLRLARAEREAVERRFALLTPREREVLALIAAGRLNKQIAAALGTVEKTVKFHRANLMRKLGVRTVAELVRLAERAGVAAARPDA